MALIQICKTTVFFSLLSYSLAATNSSSVSGSNSTSTSKVVTASTKFNTTSIPITSSSRSTSILSNSSSSAISSSSQFTSKTIVVSTTSTSSTGTSTGATSSTSKASSNGSSSTTPSTSSTSKVTASGSSSKSGSSSSTTPSSSTSPPSSTSSTSGTSASPGSSSTTVPPPTSQSPTSTTSSSTGSSTFPVPPPNVVITGVLGTITVGPQTSTETGDFTSMQTGIPGLTANSATQTSRDGHNTILPIWFLSPGIGIIKLPPIGLPPVGGIIPPPPGFPPLFIGSDGSPTAGGPPEGNKDPQTSSTDNPTSTNPTSTNPTSSKPSSSSTSCTSTAVPSCVQTCIPITDAKGASTVTCGQPRCTTITGCSATATTSTTTSAQPTCTSGCNDCLKFQGDGETVPADNGGNDEIESGGTQSGGTAEKREPPSIAGRVPFPIQLLKRADDFDTFNAGTANACQLTKNLKIPNYPTPGKLPGKAAGGAQFWWVMTETTVPNSCPVLDYNKVTDADVTNQKINPADTTTYTKGGDWSRLTPTVNVDHVYELSILKQFFSSRITAANCADFKKFFDVADGGSPQVAGDTRLQTIWRQLPSNTNPDFAGMDAKINAVKAQAFSNAFSNPTGSEKSLSYLYELALAFKLTNDPLVSPLFQKTNNRIYAALLGMDAVINGANCGSTTTPVITGDWAASYKTWITNLLASAGTNVNAKVSQVLADNARLGPSAQVGPGSTTGADGTATATTNSIGRGVSAFLAAYPTPNAFTFNVANLVVFPTTATLNIKRQACSRPPPSGSSSTTGPSSTQTSLPPSSTAPITSVKPTTSIPPSSIPPSSIPPSSSVPASSSSSRPITNTSLPPSSSRAPTTSSRPASSTVSSIPPATTSNVPSKPSSCPAGCQCFKSPQGGCDCLCS
ncbi:hypothetical protein B0J14DRAFT_668683 [Halenospora varia]|nr:hypothetical protein B0J14DRAFT_668683 [Halenospora varia]